ncbi:MAG TPA: hypothetical protein VN628_01635 [Vicinamibacterales bacterium]|nr:hypothetical protein [Vicinamibacterales bacterium]
MPGIFTGDTRELAGFPKALMFLPNGLERGALLVTELSRFFSEPPELFCVVSGGLGGLAMLFCRSAIVLGALPGVFGFFTGTFRLLAVLL